MNARSLKFIGGYGDLALTKTMTILPHFSDTVVISIPIAHLRFGASNLPFLLTRLSLPEIVASSISSSTGSMRSYRISMFCACSCLSTCANFLSTTFLTYSIAFQIILTNYSYCGGGLTPSPAVAVIVIAQESLAPIS
jgi:hypothetical protein